MDKMNSTINLCNNRSKKHYVKWAAMTIFMAVCCIPAGFYPFLHGPFAWGPLIGTTIGTISIVIFLRSMMVIMKPEQGKLGKSLQPYFDGTINTDIQVIFARIDKDMEENGKQFGYVWVGNKWVLGGEAMLIHCIRGIFSFKIWKGKQYEYDICLVDDRQNVQVTNLIYEKELDALSDYLTSLLPLAATGGFKEYMAFIAKDEEEVEAFNEAFLHPEEQPRDFGFIFTEANGMPTSLATVEEILLAINELLPGQQVRLAACIPPPSDQGDCIDITGCQFEEDDQYALMVRFRNDQGSIKVFMLRCIPVFKVQEVMFNFYESQKVPDVSTWEDQSHLLYEEPPMEDYVLYVDEHRYDHITYDDVQASFENLCEGKCKSVLIRTPGWQNGYLEVTGKKDNYVVEVAGFDSNHEICGYRTHTIYGGHVIHWFSEYYHQYKYPEIRDDWEDITREIQKRMNPSQVE